VARASHKAHVAPDQTTTPVLLFGPTPPPSPQQPLLARDLTADDLERWVGWKRFVRGVQVVPDTRGKDLDLAFSGRGIRTTLTRWLDAARHRAAREPGELLVVVAGDGLNPTRDRLSDTWDLFQAHRRVVLDPNLHYLRIQHAQGTHLSWMKDFLHALAERPAGAHSVSLQWEAEHGATVNVVMVLRRSPEEQGGEYPGDRPWSLDGFEALCCAVVLSDLEATGTDDYKVGLFTERIDGHPHRVNQELLHFGRAHCEGLLTQDGTRVRSEHGAPPLDDFERCLVAQLARWIERVRVWRTTSRTAPRDPEARGRWVARRLGLADARLARALAREMERDGPIDVAARELWASVPPWPGEYWTTAVHAATTPPQAGRTPPRDPGSTGPL
jgi:hypothetical protein